MVKELLKKFIPSFLISWYHFSLAFLGAVVYRFPSRKMIVIGVTGTKGKTTTCNIIAQILNLAGLKTGMASTVNFRIGDREWINKTKQTMLGRFKLQKLLSQMLKEGCKFAVVETSSEGILQHRHRFIDYNVAVLTNLSPEHIERHGNFENYRAAKMKLFEKVSQKKEGAGIYNLDDKNIDYFLKYLIKNKFGFTKEASEKLKNRIQIKDIELSANKTKFKISNIDFESKIIGEFNVYNLACAICAVLSQGITLEKIREVLPKVNPAPGRLEVINGGQDFIIIVDYSYEPTSLENALKAVKVFNPNKIISVFGSAAGGRDKWRRPVMGEVANKYADLIIVTTDDPYDENPEKIIDDILTGVFKDERRSLNENVFKVIDRREAIKKSLSLAGKDDLVLISGKGGEVWMNVAGGKKIPWDDREVVLDEFQKLD